MRSLTVEYSIPTNDEEQNPYCRGYSFSPEKTVKSNDLTFRNTLGWQTSSERIANWNKFWKEYDEDTKQNRNAKSKQVANRVLSVKQTTKRNLRKNASNKRRIK